MIETFFQDLALSLSNFGTGAYLIVSLLVLFETIVVVGQFIPGSLFLIMVGFLCYMRVFDFTGMAISVVLAHLAGEFVNYALGRFKGRSLFHEDSRFFKPKFLDMAQSRFEASGARLLITGQFLGFLRPFISLAAGAAHYSPTRFFFAELFACSVWALAHLALGFFFGASWQKAVGYMRDFSLVLIVAIPLAIFSGWCVRQLLAMSGSLYKFLERLNRIIRSRPWFRRLNKRHPHLFAFVENRISLSQPWGLAATFGFACSLLFLVFCVVILWDVRTRDNWYTFDLSLVNLLAQLRTPGADQFFLVITHLGTAPVVTAVVVLAAVASFSARQQKSFFVIVGSVVLSMIASEALEKVFQRHRPDLALHLIEAHGFSFPSGHATVAFALFGSLYYWLWNHPGILRIRATLAFILLLAAFLVGFSRVYLGVHYPSDVVAGFCLGFSGVLACGTVAANWARLADVQKRADFKAAIIMFFYGLAAFSYAYTHPVAVPHGGSAETPATAATLKQALPYLPRVSTTLFGFPYVPVTLIIEGSPVALVEKLESDKWTRVRPQDFFSRGMADPVFPAFLSGKPAAYTLQQETQAGRRIIRLWKTSGKIGTTELWLGSIVEQQRLKKWRAIDVYHQSPDIDLALLHLESELDQIQASSINSFRSRGLYKWKNEFFTYGNALRITLPEEESKLP
jgi:undecaprenyl-diphosphatase